MANLRKLLFGAVTLLLIAACNQAPPPEPVTEQSMSSASASLVPAGPWGDGDQVGMANALGNGTWMRCAHYMSQPGAKSYELSHVRSNDTPPIEQHDIKTHQP